MSNVDEANKSSESKTTEGKGSGDAKRGDNPSSSPPLPPPPPTTPIAAVSHDAAFKTAAPPTTPVESTDTEEHAKIARSLLRKEATPVLLSDIIKPEKKPAPRVDSPETANIVKREASILRFRELWEVLPPTIPNRHPLHCRWVFWYLKGDRTKDWKDCLRKVTTFDSVEGFWSVVNHLIQPSSLGWGSDFYVFREGIKPMWEDDQNVRGGRWLVMVDKHKRHEVLDHYWMEMLLALIGEQFDEDGNEICGAVVNIRQKGDKVALWTRDAHRDAKNYRVGQILYKALGIKNDYIRYEVHKDASVRTGSIVKPRIVIPARGMPSAVDANTGGVAPPKTVQQQVPTVTTMAQQSQSGSFTFDDLVSSCLHPTVVR